MKFPPAAALAIRKSACGPIVVLLCCLCGLSQSQQTASSAQQLFAAINNGDLVAVEHLIQHGANIEARGTNGVTPLMTAAEGGNVAIVSLLLDNGANPEAKDEQDQIALTYASRGGFVRVVNLLARLSNQKGKDQALFAAVDGGPVCCIEIEVAPGQPNPVPNQAAAIEESWTATVESLLDSGADIEARNQDGSTPLIWAAVFAQTDVFKLLIRRGARLDVTDKDGNTPLIAAACECALATMNSSYDIVKILLDLALTSTLDQKTAQRPS